MSVLQVALKSIRAVIDIGDTKLAVTLLDQLIDALRRESRPALARRLRGSRWRWLRAAVFKRDGYACVYCGDPVDFATGHADHVVPISRGGSNAASNLATACLPCNLSKGARTPQEWRA